MKTLFFLASLLIPADASCQTAPPENQAVMFRGNTRHTGVYNEKGVPAFHKIKWKFHTNGFFISSPAIDSSTAYIGSTDGSLYALQ